MNFCNRIAFSALMIMVDDGPGIWVPPFMLLECDLSKPRALRHTVRRITSCGDGGGVLGPFLIRTWPAVDHRPELAR